MSTLASVTIYDVFSNLPSPGIPGRLFFVSSGTNAGNTYYDTGSAWQPVATSGGGGGSSFPLAILQECATQSGGSNVNSFMITFPAALQSSGATAFMLVGCDGSASVGLPSGWTADINQTEATYARFILCHKASAGDTNATFTCTNSSFSIYFFEVSGSHALDQSSIGGMANTGVVPLPAITPTANSLVFGAVAVVCNGLYDAVLSPVINPAWRTCSVQSQVSGGGRGLGFNVGTGAAANVSTTPPAASIPIDLYSGGGIAYATFSIL